MLRYQSIAVLPVAMVTLYLASPSSAGSYVARFGESLELGEVGAAIGGESERAHGYDSGSAGEVAIHGIQTPPTVAATTLPPAGRPRR